MIVSSAEDCTYEGLFEPGFPRGYGARVGMTRIIADQPTFSGEVVLYPSGRGYVANKNKIIGVVRGERGGVLLSIMCELI